MLKQTEWKREQSLVNFKSQIMLCRSFDFHIKRLADELILLILRVQMSAEKN